MPPSENAQGCTTDENRAAAIDAVSRCLFTLSRAAQPPTRELRLPGISNCLPNGVSEMAPLYERTGLLCFSTTLM